MIRPRAVNPCGEADVFGQQSSGQPTSVGARSASGTSKFARMLHLAESDPAKRRFRIFHPTVAMQEMANFLPTGER